MRRRCLKPVRRDPDVIRAELARHREALASVAPEAPAAAAYRMAVARCERELAEAQRTGTDG